MARSWKASRAFWVSSSLEHAPRRRHTRAADKTRMPKGKPLGITVACRTPTRPVYPAAER